MRIASFLLAVLTLAISCISIAQAECKNNNESTLEKQAKLEIRAKRDYEREQERDRSYSDDDQDVNACHGSDKNGIAIPDNITVLFAQGKEGNDRAVGFMIMGRELRGATGSFSGNLHRDDGTIDTSIPHDNFHTEQTTGTYGLQFVQGAGSRSTMFIFGAGLTVKQTLFTDVSNVTGWRWDGGEKYSIKPSAQAGCRIKITNSFALHLGWDTSQGTYFGVGGKF
jgi:hypothetical protein